MNLGKIPCQRRPLLLACLSRMLRRMTDGRRALLRKLEHADAFPLVALQALRELRADLDALEAEAMVRARELGASLEDIAEALEITRQGVSYRLKVLAESGRDDDGPAEDEIVDVREPDPRGARSH
jgi:DNA-binding transcriptional ArsR family regulator